MSELTHLVRECDATGHLQVILLPLVAALVPFDDSQGTNMGDRLRTGGSQPDKLTQLGREYVATVLRDTHSRVLAFLREAAETADLPLVAQERLEILLMALGSLVAEGAHEPDNLCSLLYSIHNEAERLLDDVTTLADQAAERLVEARAETREPVPA